MTIAPEAGVEGETVPAGRQEVTELSQQDRRRFTPDPRVTLDQVSGLDLSRTDDSSLLLAVCAA